MQGQFAKTKLCSYFQNGKCKKASEECQFAHNESELRAQPQLNCTKICRAIVHGGDCTNPDCHYAHSATDLEAVQFQDTHKTAICFFHSRGKCLNGSKCRFAHGVSDLRDRTSPSKSKVLPSTSKLPMSRNRVATFCPPPPPPPPSSQPPAPSVPPPPLSTATNHASRSRQSNRGSRSLPHEPSLHESSHPTPDSSACSLNPDLVLPRPSISSVFDRKKNRSGTSPAAPSSRLNWADCMTSDDESEQEEATTTAAVKNTAPGRSSLLPTPGRNHPSSSIPAASSASLFLPPMKTAGNYAMSVANCNSAAERSPHAPTTTTAFTLYGNGEVSGMNRALPYGADASAITPTTQSNYGQMFESGEGVVTPMRGACLSDYQVAFGGLQSRMRNVEASVHDKAAAAQNLRVAPPMCYPPESQHSLVPPHGSCQYYFSPSSSPLILPSVPSLEYVQQLQQLAYLEQLSQNAQVSHNTVAPSWTLVQLPINPTDALATCGANGNRTAAPQVMLTSSPFLPQLLPAFYPLQTAESSAAHLNQLTQYGCGFPANAAAPLPSFSPYPAISCFSQAVAAVAAEHV